MTRRDRKTEPTKAPPTRAFVIHVETKASGDSRSPEARLAEAEGLALAIDLDMVGSAVVKLAAMRPSTLIGAGKVEEIAARVAELEAGLVIFNAQLTPGQQRNLEKALKAKVLDRTGLILEIFGRRARTREGALQVELAHLTYQKSRLVRSWTHLERQRGGFGFLGGPGETQIEADRRMIEERVAKLEKELEGVRKTRALHRKGRARVPYPIVALVGYTNAGKSTLFNTLTRAGVDARDLLFATLDPTMRQVKLPHGRRIVLSDTVGFISDLPTMLIAAFRATLEEVLEADVILHVRDMASPEAASEADDVAKVLDGLGIDERRRNDTVLEVWNKADLLPEDQRRALGQSAARREDAVLVSALTGEGLDGLLARIEARLARKGELVSIALEAEEGAELAWIYGHAEVLERTDDGKRGRVRLMARFEPSKLAVARRRFGARLEAPEAFSLAAE